MRSVFRRALRGTLSAVSLLAFLALFLALEAGVASPRALAGLAALGFATLVAGGGRDAVSRLLRRQSAESEAGDGADAAGDHPGWWLARVEPALDDSWNRWSDVVLTVGLAVIGVGSFALLVTYPGGEPPLGLLVTGTLGINGALMTLAFALD